jgi:hypothetical protein
VSDPMASARQAAQDGAVHPAVAAALEDLDARLSVVEQPAPYVAPDGDASTEEN